MSAYDWLMAFGAVAIIAFLIKAFWRANKIDAIDQPDSLPPGATPTDGQSGH